MIHSYLKKGYGLLLTAIICIASAVSVHATHVAGADLTYKSLGGNNYEITLTYFRDCSGSMPTNTENIRVSAASCGYDFNVTVTAVPGTGNEITFPCNSGNGSTCTGGSSFGVQKWTFTAVVQLPGACADWNFSWNRCCRNCAITTTVHGNCQGEPQSNFYLEANLNNLTVATNNSPTFTQNPVTTLCLGQNFVFNHGAVDTDGDSLVYSIVGSQIAQGTTVTYQPGYSAANPMTSSPAITIDPVNGDMNMNPTQQEIGVMAVKVDEYRNGVLIGTVTRDMQFIVQPCNNNLPTASGINGTAVFDTLICPGTQLCFYVFSNDADAGQHLTLTTNNAIPGSIFNNSGGTHPTASFCWTPTLADARSTPWTFTLTVRDDACPSNGLQTYSYSIMVPEIQTSTIADNINGTIDLTVMGNTGPYTINWSNGATTEDLTGLTPGVYTATVCEVNGCCVTVTDSIVPPPSCVFTVHTSRSYITCNGACDGSITLTPTGGTAPYTYVWSNGNTTNSASGLCAGTYLYTVTDANGCTYACHSVMRDPVVLTASVSGSNTCSGACMGSATVIANGGKAPYTYLWSNGETTDAVANLCDGTYTVTVTDSKGCTATGTYTVNSFQALSLITYTASSTCPNPCNGRMTAVVSGGTPGYSFNWSNGASSIGLSADSITGVCPGSYCVTVTDQNGCSRSASNIVGPVTSRPNTTANEYAAKAGSDAVEFKATAIPNPFSNDFTIETGNMDQLKVRVFTIAGELVKEYNNVYPSQHLGGDLSNGLYLVEISQNGNTVIQRLSKQDR